MTVAQIRALMGLLMLKGVTLHHGDCIGADQQAAEIAEKLGHQTVGHPPTNQSKRAFHPSTKTLPAKDYLERDKDIVDASERLLAAPKGYEEERRSGTWFTVRYARRMGKKVTIIFPDGSLG